jgi:hypothetical protein
MYSWPNEISRWGGNFDLSTVWFIYFSESAVHYLQCDLSISVGQLYLQFRVIWVHWRIELGSYWSIFCFLCNILWIIICLFSFGHSIFVLRLTNVVGSNIAQPIQHYVIKCVSDLRQIDKRLTNTNPTQSVSELIWHGIVRVLLH